MVNLFKYLSFLTLTSVLLWSCGFSSQNKQATQQEVVSTPEELPLPFYNSPEFTPEWFEPSDSGYASIHTVGSFNLTNQHGKEISKNDVKGKIVVANFFFTICPGICPKMMGNMGILQEEFASDSQVVILSHTVTPWIDSVPVMHEYAERNQITSPNWHLLTGTKKDIYHLARGSYFADEGFGKNVTLENDFLHTENVVLLDKKMRIRGVYSGTLPLQIRKLVEDIRFLQAQDAE